MDSTVKTPTSQEAGPESTTPTPTGAAHDTPTPGPAPQPRLSEAAVATTPRPGAAQPGLALPSPTPASVQVNPDQVLEAPPAGHGADGVDDDDEFTPQEMNEQSLGESTSVNSSVYQHCYHNGRRYHKFRHGRYPIPNDEFVQDWEDMQHAMMLEVTDGNHFFAPIDDAPQKIIDLGCGTGIWTIEVADRFPSAEVLGVDLSPIQPIWTPPNVKFIVDDVEDSWLNGDSWDLVHFRNLAIMLKDPAKLVRQAFAHTRPGGWIELQEMESCCYCDDGTMPDDWPIKGYCDVLRDAWAHFGFDAHAAAKGYQYLTDAGYVNVQMRAYKIPYGTWPKDKTQRLIGMYFRECMNELISVMTSSHLPAMGWGRAESELLSAQVRRALRDNSVHTYNKKLFWWGQKPYAS